MFRTLRPISTSLPRLTHRSIQPQRLTFSQIRTMSFPTLIKLNTGANIPAIGFGTWQDKDAQEDAVLAALKAGYRHIDTARVYGTEPAVGRAIKTSGIPRSEIFITTKLWNNSHAPEDVEPALDASLKDLDTDYVNLYLIHWPSAFKPSSSLFPKDSNGKNIPAPEIDYVETWKAMERVLKTGKAKAIGISNFSRREVERVLEEGSVVPAAHQLECHPWLQQKEFVEWQKEKGIVIQHYSPFGNQNESYDKGKQFGKLMVCFLSLVIPSLLHGTIAVTDGGHDRMTQFWLRLARNTTRQVRKLHWRGALHKVMLCCQNQRLLQG